jgi:hypothetical protein
MTKTTKDRDEELERKLLEHELDLFKEQNENEFEALEEKNNSDQIEP